IVKKVIPEKEIEVHIFSKEIKNLYVDSRRFKDAVTIAGIVVLIITLIGLIGYSQDEINRRRSEIAIRKINGATVSILMKMFLKNILKLALPSAIAGCIAAYYISMNWLEQYSEKIELNWWLFAACGVATIILISTVVTITIYKAANANPVENLKSE
ncbi:MAG: FtsX-like permease family protein, partial [Bacteroidales bacterium]